MRYDYEYLYQTLKLSILANVQANEYTGLKYGVVPSHAMHGKEQDHFSIQGDVQWTGLAIALEQAWKGETEESTIP